MDDETLSELLRLDVGSKTSEVIRQIDEIWQRNLRPMRDDQDTCRRVFQELKERYKKNSEVIAQLRTKNEALSAELNKANHDKEIYAQSLRDLEDRCASMESNLHKVVDERDAVLANLQVREKQLDSAKQAEDTTSTELTKSRADLRNAEDQFARLRSQYDRDIAEYQHRLAEQETSARIRMEDQKKEIERRITEECCAKLKKYDVAHYKMKYDFEAALQKAHAETNELVLERDEYLAQIQKLVEEREAYRERTRIDMQKLAAEKWHELVNQLGLREDVGQKFEFAPKQPHYYAERFLRDLKNKNTNAASSVSARSLDDNEVFERSRNSSSENEPPPRKSSRRSASVSAAPKAAQSFAPTLVFGRQRRNATGGSTTATSGGGAARNAGPTTTTTTTAAKGPQFRRESRSVRK